MIRKLCNLWIRKKTRNLTRVPLFTMTFNYQHYKKVGEEESCVWYSLHPCIINDRFLREKMRECVDHIRKTYNMEMFTKV